MGWDELMIVSMRSPNPVLGLGATRPLIAVDEIFMLELDWRLIEDSEPCGGYRMSLDPVDPDAFAELQSEQIVEPASAYWSTLTCPFG